MKSDDDGISFFPADYSDFWSMYGYKFDSILEYIREYLRELDLIQRHISEIIDIYMEIYFFVHAHLYRYDLGEPLGELYTCSKEWYTGDIEILYRENLGDDIRSGDELVHEKLELFFYFAIFFRISEIVHDTICLEYRTSERRSHFMRDDTDKFFLFADEIIVFDSFIIDTTVELFRELFQFRIRLDVSYMCGEKVSKVNEDFYFLFCIKISKGLRAELEYSVTRVFGKKRKHEEYIFWEQCMIYGDMLRWLKNNIIDIKRTFFGGIEVGKKSCAMMCTIFLGKHDASVYRKNFSKKSRECIRKGYKIYNWCKRIL